jgi:hypothetical protein
MKILERIKQFIWWYCPFAWRDELLSVEETLLELVAANQEYELLMRNDLRLMFNAMNKMNEKKPVEKTEEKNDFMFG